MTAINFTFTERQALVVTDSLTSAGYETTKAYAFPHLRLVIGTMGQIGFTRRWLSEFMLGMPGQVADVEELDEYMPGYLRGLWKPDCTPSNIFHFGVTAADTIAVFGYSSTNDFESQRYAPGLAYICPAFAASAIEPAPSVIERPAEPSTQSRDTDEPSTWSGRTRAILYALNRQHTAHPEKVRGRAFCTHLTADVIHQNWLGELSAIETA